MLDQGGTRQRDYFNWHIVTTGSKRFDGIGMAIHRAFRAARDAASHASGP
jgi:hypothetical protein